MRHSAMGRSPAGRRQGRDGSPTMRFTAVLGTLVVAACLLLALPAWGATDESASPAASAATPAAGSQAEARALIDGGRFADALVILGPLVRGAAVEPDLYFLFGLAAVGASQRPGLAEEGSDALLDGAIAAFHEMLIDQPGLVRVHLELGRAFFLKGEDDLARQHFEAVLAGGVPQPVAINVVRFLNQIRARRRWSFNVGFALAPDSNIGSSSAERIIYVPFGGIDLPFHRNAEELTTSGIGVSVWGGAEYQVPLAERLRLRAGGQFARREYEGSQFDQLFLGTHLGPRWLVDRETEVSLLASARQSWTGTAPDNRAFGARLEVGRRLSQQVTAFLRASWHDRRYRTQTHLDGPVMDSSLSGAWVVTPTVRTNLTLGYGRERPDSERERNRSRWLGAGVSVILPLGFTVGGSGEVRWTDYETGWFPHTPPGEDRADRTHSLRASVHNRAFTLMGFSPELVVVREERSTNAQLYDYERTRGELRFVQQF